MDEYQELVDEYGFGSSFDHELRLLNEFSSSYYFTCASITIFMNKIDLFIGILLSRGGFFWTFFFE